MEPEEIKKLKALAFSYLMIAASDGDISRIECEKFYIALESQNWKSELPTETIHNVFEDTRDFFTIKYDEAENETLDRVKEYEDDEFKKTIISVSRRAIVADEVLEDTEEVVIKKIAEKLKFQNA